MLEKNDATPIMKIINGQQKKQKKFNPVTPFSPQK